MCLYYTVCLYFPYIKTCNQSSKNIYLRLVFKQKLVSCQKILLLKQLHVLTEVFHIVNWICLKTNKESYFSHNQKTKIPIFCFKQSLIGQAH